MNRLGQFAASSAKFGNPSSLSLNWQLKESIAVPICCGVLVAVAVAIRSWVMLAVLLAIPLVMLIPVEFAFGLLALAIYFDNLNPLGGTVTLSFLVAAVSGAVLLVATLAGARLVNPPRPASWFVLLFLWTMLSAFWAMDPKVSLERLPSLAALGALYLIAVSMRISEREFAWVTRLIVLGGCIASAVSMYQYAHGINVSDRASIVLGSVVTNPNDLAITMLLPLSLAIGLVLSNRGITRVLSVVAAMLLLACLILTMSRGGFVALGVLTAVHIYRKGFDWRLLAVVGLTVVAILFAPALLMTRMGEALTSRAQGRFDIWLVGFEVIKHHGLFGVGLDNFPLAFEKYAGHQVVFRRFSLVPHNIYLQALAETGVVGLFLLLGALRIQMKQVAGALREGGARAAALLVPCEAAAWGVMTHAMVANVLWRKVFWFVWIMVALAVHLERRLRNCEGQTSPT
jgi:putative inorganic carbon (hco3(-)) transporter